ncbi:pectinesterase family protein [Alistipes sp. An66]|uniref:pectinesterase family protein n=1 Tax=Alistipes sp. An66 TaxID=1965650 RepID=UPI0013A66226|nr:pectinesterase family protein [Alistipes sp. An66]
MALCMLLSAPSFGGPLRVFLIGDSTCATKDLAKQNPERGWGQMFQPLFDGSVTVENHAVNGRSTKSFRDEGRWDPILDRLQAGDWVFIQFGHNDQKAQDSTRYADPAQYAENLRRYVRETRAKGAVPVLLTPIVRRHFSGESLDDTHGAYLDAVRRVAAGEQTPLIDAERLTRAWVAGLGDEASKAFYMWVEEGTCPLCPEGRQDNTHLNVRGARTVARMIAAQLPQAVPELGERLVPSDFTVARDGSGDFFTLTEAVAALPDFGRDTTRIVICGGVYREKISIPATKRLVALTGRGDVTLTWDDYAAKIGPTGRPLGTSGSSTLYFGGDGWTVRGITFENTAGRVGQAVAVQCLATELRFIGCRFLGNQDTLYLYGTGNRDGERVTENARIRFEECYIEGTTDFIFGSAAALFRRCEIRSKADSYVTAASTCRGQRCGLIFVECRLTADEGVTACWLGRPWRDYAQTLFLRCHLGAHIRPEGWHDWNKPRTHRTAFYAECASEGPGAAGRRVPWARRIEERRALRIVAAFDR